MNRRLLVVVICLLLFLVFLLNKEFNSAGDHHHENSIAILKDKTHDVQARKAKSLSWDDVNPGEGFQYYDSLLTMKDSRADVAFNDGTNLELGPDSLVVLEPPLEKQSEMRFNLKKGSATLHLKKGKRIEAKDKIISAKEDATIQLSSDTQSIEDMIFVEEDIKANSPVQISSLPKSESKNRSPAQTRVKPLRGPKIKSKFQVLKIEGSYQVNPPKSLFQNFFLLLIPEAIADEVKSIPKLEWESLPDAISYDVEFSTDKEFLNIIMTKTTKNSVTNWNQNKPGTFYWRVRGIDKDGNAGEFSEVASFEAVQSPPSQEEVIQTSIEPPRPKSLILPQARMKPIPTPQPQQPPIIADIEPRPHAAEWLDRPRGLFALEVRGLANWGSMADTAGNFPYRSMLTGTGALAIGLHFGNFTPSLYSEYFISNQMTQPSSVQNQNASGSGYLLGGELKWRRKRFSVAGSYLFLGQYQSNQPTIQLQKSIYDKPMGVGLILGWAITHRLSFLIDEKYVTYSDWNLTGDISANKISQISYGIGLSYEFF